LRIPCPISGCSNTAAINQNHTCGGQVEVSNRANIRCRSCGTISHIRNWNFSCSNHDGDYRQATANSANSIVSSLMVALRDRTMDESVVMELIQYLRNY
jgi:hypothetical protein